MATYIKGLTDLVPEIKPFQPNLNLVQQALSTLQNRYDQGFASVRNVYNQILNAPISNFGNQAVRDSFLKEAEMKLKNLASVDLSLPENQAAAEQVFAPFWEDGLILQDQGMTKAYRSEVATANMYKNSKDEKMRAQYNDIAMRYLTNGMEQLQNASRDPASFAKVEKRRFVPFQDLQAYLDQRAKDMNLEIKWQSENGPELKTITGGPQSVPSFESFAHNALGDQFTEQFRVMAVVDKETRIRQLKLYDPTMTDEQAVRELSRGVIKDQRGVLTGQQKRLNAELKKVTDQLAPYLALTDMDEKQEAAYKQLRAQEKQLGEAVTAAGKKVTDFDEQVKKDPDAFVVGLDSYYANVIKNRTIQRWANTRAAKQDEKIELHPIWDAERKLEKEKRDYDLNLRRTIVAEQNLLFQKYKWDHPQKKTKGKSSSSGGSGDEEEVDITDPEQVGKVEAVDAAHATKLGDKVEVFENEQNERWNSAHQLLFSEDVGGRLLEKMGVSIADAVQYMGAMRKLIYDPSGKEMTEKDKGLLFNLSQVLQGKKGEEDLVTIDMEGGKITKKVAGYSDKDFYGVRKDLLHSLSEELGELYREDGVGFDDKDFRMLIAYMTASQELQQHNSLEDAKSKAVEKYVAGEEKYKDFVVDKSGKKSLITADDLASYFKPIILFEGDKPSDKATHLRLSAKEVAEFYMKGAFTGRMSYGTPVVHLNGKRYGVIGYGDINPKGKPSGNFVQWVSTDKDIYEEKYNTSSGNAYAAFRGDMLALNERFGSSEKFKSKMDAVYEKVIPNLPQYKGKTGVQGYVVSYEFDPDKKPNYDVASQLIKEAHHSSNFEGIYMGDELLQSNDPRLEKVLTALSQGEKDLEKTVSIVRVNMRGIKGRPSLEVVFKQATGNKLPEGQEENSDFIKDLAGKTVEIDLNPNPTGDMLKKIRNNPDNYVYGTLMEGKVFKSDPILNNTHISFDIIPNDPEHPTGATLEMHAKEFVNGEYVDVVLEPVRYLWSSITPDQLVNEAYRMVALQHKKNLEARKLFYAQQKTEGKMKTRVEIDKELKGG